MPITLEEAIEKKLVARDAWAEAVGRLAVAQYRQELAIQEDGERETRQALAEGKGITFASAKEAIKWLKGGPDKVRENKLWEDAPWLNDVNLIESTWR